MEKLTFKVNEYEGPLDLILALLSKHQIGIYDINISDLLEQYMAYIRTLRENQMEVASEFLEMASRLVYIKTASLLPRYEKEEDPRAELVGQLLEYQSCKQAAALLRLRDTRLVGFYPGAHAAGDRPYLPPPSPHQRADQRLLVGLRQRKAPPAPAGNRLYPAGRQAYGFGGKPHYAPAAGLLPPGPGQPAKHLGR